MKARRLILMLALAGCLAWEPTASATVTSGSRLDGGSVYITFDLATAFSELGPVSASDLINGFGVNTNGSPINQGINESARAPFIYGWIDPYNGFVPPEPGLPGVGSWYMGSGGGGCRPILYEQPSSGFYEGLPGNGDMPDLVDGVAGNYLKSVLRDYARGALVVRYGFQNPVDIGRVRIFAANLTQPPNAGKDGRVFQYYDVYARQGNCGDGTCPAHGNYPDLIGFEEFFPVALGVSTGAPGFVTNSFPSNPTPWEGTQTDVISFNSNTLIEDCTDLRIVLYCVSNTQKFFIDPWQGYANDPGAGDACSSGVPAESVDVDGYPKAFEAPIIKEIDVFGPINTPWGDIDYNGKVDLIDFSAFQFCFGGDINTNGCYRFDYSQDQAINEPDVTGFVADLTGP